ncbi:ABC transporter ATP-binding protein [Anaeromicrobium sediminis]|uniref:ABC transporter domain-containing protein n=1 Tax=Anaeromicrobium sediminis TaxID=1478221 RepID=A0A267MK18_9FIRM|nr:ABC transporter ATP-binding protein [Anaeromicrobium sediminis]PAB59876.1 hypothetical protein CCE28_07940 [Anaeromicrobium sediminis]
MNITMENLYKIYNNKKVLDIGNLTFEKNKIYGIVGPNGAGKSTLLKIIASLEKPTEGIILYESSPISSENLKGMTYVSQNPYLLDRSCFNNISYPLQIRKMDNKTIEDRVLTIMKDFKIEYLKEQMATKLSAGEGQKVALARALVFKPELLLLDEPTANMDPSSIEMVEHILLNKIKPLGTTIIIITHNIGQAKRICDEIVYIEDGIIYEKEENNNFFRTDNLKTRKFLSLEYTDMGWKYGNV